MQFTTVKIFPVITSVIFLLSTLFAQTIYAEEYSIAPKPDWVTSIVPNDSDSKDDLSTSDGVVYTLVDQQANISLKEEERYYHYVEKALSISGVEQISQISIDFDPSYETLILHEILIHRKGEAIDRIPRSQIRLIQREKELEYAIYDGSKTLAVFVEDVRRGDSIEYSYTIKGMNPVFSGHFSSVMLFGWSVPVQNIHYRVVWPVDRPLAIKNHLTNIQPLQRSHNDVIEYVWQTQKTAKIVAESDTPHWFSTYPKVFLSDYANWKEVVDWAVPLYSTGEGGRELQTVIESIQNETDDPEQQILQALEFVQEHVRYLGIEMGIRSHKPSSPEVILKQRFGDCKDKSRLLVALLDGMGVKAVPALVNTRNGRQVKVQLPTPKAFNHAIVAVTYKGKKYWLDPTLKYQSGTLENIYKPDYEYALLLSEGKEDLVKMSDNINGVHSKAVEEVFTLSDSVEALTPYSIISYYQNYYADYTRKDIAKKGLEELQQSYMKYTASYYPDVKISEMLKTQDDEKRNILSIEENYTVPNIWIVDEDKRYVSLGLWPFLILDHVVDVDSPRRDTPYAVTHPVQYKHITKIAGMANSIIEKESIEIVDKAFRFTKKVELSDDIVTIEYFYESLADYVAPENLKNFSSNIKKVRNLAFYQIQKPNPAIEFGTYSYAPSDINWILIGPMLLTLICLLFICYGLIYRHDPSYSIPENIDKRFQGLSGWLILPCLGIIATPVIIIYQMKDTWHLFSAKQWSIVQDQMVDGLGILIVVEMMYNTAIIVFILTLVTLFFQRRNTFPKFYITFLVLNLIFLVADNTTLSFLEGNIADGSMESISVIWQQAFYSLIWCLYMVKSKRVRATFTRDLRKSDRSGAEVLKEAGTDLDIKN